MKNQSGVEKAASSSNKPYSAWSATEGKDIPEAWNAAPGSQLKTGSVLGLPSQSISQWEVPNTSFALGGETGAATSSAGETKAAMPHTAELVSSSEPPAIIPRTSYVLFGYSPFSPATTMLDAAVDSTIGTVTSPRTVSGHSPLLLDPSSLALESPLGPEALSSTELVTDTPAHQSPQLPAASKAPGGNLASQTTAKGLPPRLKAGAGRGRGAGPKGGGGGGMERKRKGRIEKDQVGKPDSEQQTASLNEVSDMVCIIWSAYEF